MICDTFCRWKLSDLWTLVLIENSYPRDFPCRTAVANKMPTTLDHGEFEAQPTNINIEYVEDNE
jgi:hypothetical protein